ncbi:hypothetical protein BDY17DRAFT_355214 [Neohortaea acidophila]|uniref:VanZ-like domain-containing protein n=1 Tax=Neohortaea acidophila TaxID=245834 RepID=A0A6A6PN38_9PEZI|nr:uncharacterized protein BDY17DRAFT_355214 [Neohortaea acidophila]KAF2481518.1 hypothetical protein BDY17DRAFT_355214 [Neohortaea acidophila]
MPAARIRQPFAAAFAVLVLLAAYLGLSTTRIPTPLGSDKGLHFVTFFLLSATFYWIIETSRRRCIHLTLVVCTAGLSVGSEVVQGLIPNNGREFDPFDIVANVVGSALALALCSWYHKRMLERKRKNRHYDIVPGDDVPEGDEEDVELGLVRDEDAGGVVPVEAGGDSIAGAVAVPKASITEELDNWDENAEDWEEDDEDTAADVKEGDGQEETKKRTD